MAAFDQSLSKRFRTDTKKTLTLYATCCAVTELSCTLDFSASAALRTASFVIAVSTSALSLAIASMPETMSSCLKRPRYCKAKSFARTGTWCSDTSTIPSPSV